MAVTLPNIEEICRRHLQFYESLYSEANPKNLAIIEANTAAAFLKRSNVPNAVLGEIWNIADYDHKRCLDKKGFFIALKLIALVQQGREPTVANLIADVAPPVITSKRNEFLNSMRTEKLHLIAPEDRQKYDEIFETLMPVNGKLSGEQVKPVLFNSGLPNKALAKIWELSDMDRDGFLDKDEMAVALHLVYRALEGDPVPEALQAEMVPPSKRLYCRSTSVAGDPLQRTSGFKFRANSVTSLDHSDEFLSSKSLASRSLTGSPSAAWNFSVDTKKWELIFNKLDKNHVGVVTGSDVKDTFLQTGLSQGCLAQIWSLCDIKNAGALDLDQFSLAMHLIEEKKNFNKGPPTSLPLDMIPPSCRSVNGGMSDMSTSTSEISQFEAKGLPSGTSSKEVGKITAEIREMQSEKRNLETEVFKTQNELNSKQASIRAMEVECDTFETTVNQLEAQKAEANKRLDELDQQRASLNETLSVLKTRLETEQLELKKLQTEAENRSALAKSQEKDLEKKKVELRELSEEESRLQMNLVSQKNRLQELTQREETVRKNVEKGRSALEKLSAQKKALGDQVAHLELLLKSGDTVEAESYQKMRSVINEMSRLSFDESVASGSAPAATAAETKPEDAKTIEDPFLSSDPFVSGVSSMPEMYDPFNDKDVFSKKDFGFSDAGFKIQSPTIAAAQDDAWFNGKTTAAAESAPTKKTPPPRPALPKVRTATPPASAAASATAAKDPFASSPNDPFATRGADQNAQFANFADFSQFN